MLIPFTFGMIPATAIIMLAGIYYGAMYGGSTTSILVNLPGESSFRHDLPRRLPDGPTRQGRRGLGDIGDRLLHRRDPERARPDAPGAPAGGLCHQLRPAEVFLPDTCAVHDPGHLAGEDSLIKGLMSGAFGIFLGTIGMDPTTGIERFSYNGIPTLLDGLSFVSVSVGLFALSEVFEMAEYSHKVPVYVDKICRIC